MSIRTKLNPFNQIKRDLITLAKLIEEGSIMAPEFHRTQLQRKSEKILTKYRIKKRAFPHWLKQK